MWKYFLSKVTPNYGIFRLNKNWIFKKMYLDKDFAYEPARFVVTVAKLVWVDSKPALVAEK